MGLALGDGWGPDDSHLPTSTALGSCHGVLDNPLAVADDVSSPLAENHWPIEGPDNGRQGVLRGTLPLQRDVQLI